MPNVGMTEEEASRLADWLLEPGLKETPLTHTFKQGIKESLPEPTHTNMVFTFFIGGVGGLAVAIVFSGLLQRRKHQQEQ
jgi:hypothetical protein